MKVEHYQQVLEHEEEVWDVVAGKVCLVVRSSFDIFDRVTAKAYVCTPCYVVNILTKPIEVIRF